MNMLISFYKSVSDLGWLKAQKKSAGRGWGYFFFLMLLLTFVFLVPTLIVLPRVLGSIKTDLALSLPAFSATVKNGGLHVSGITQPFIMHGTDGENFVVVIDTNTTTALELGDYIREKESGVLVTKDKVQFFNQRTGQEQMNQWKDIPDFAVTQADVVRLVNQYTTGPMVALLIAIVVVAFFIGSVISKLLALVFVTLVMFIAIKIAKKPWTFGELFTVGLFASTLPSILALLLPWIGVSVPLLHFLALLAFMIAVVFTKEAGESEKMVSTQ